MLYSYRAVEFELTESQFKRRKESEIIFKGDEILAVNGQPLHGLSHNEAIAVFKRIR